MLLQRHLLVAVLLLVGAGAARGADVWNVRLEGLELVLNVPRAFRLYRMMDTYSVHPPVEGETVRWSIREYLERSEIKTPGMRLTRSEEEVRMGPLSGTLEYRQDAIGENRMLIFTSKYRGRNLAVVGAWKSERGKALVLKITRQLAPGEEHPGTLTFEEAVIVQKHRVRQAERERARNAKLSRERIAETRAAAEALLATTTAESFAATLEQKGFELAEYPDLEENLELLLQTAAQYRLATNYETWWRQGREKWQEHLEYTRATKAIYRRCPICGATGLVQGAACVNCHGRGYVLAKPAGSEKAERPAIRRVVNYFDKRVGAADDLQDESKEAFLYFVMCALNDRFCLPDKLADCCARELTPPSRMKRLTVTFPGRGCYFCARGEGHSEACPLFEREPPPGAVVADGLTDEELAALNAEGDDAPPEAAEEEAGPAREAAAAGDEAPEETGP
jgi:hypothetical protein